MNCFMASCQVGCSGGAIPDEMFVERVEKA